MAGGPQRPVGSTVQCVTWNAQVARSPDSRAALEHVEGDRTGRDRYADPRHAGGLAFVAHRERQIGDVDPAFAARIAAPHQRQTGYDQRLVAQREADLAAAAVAIERLAGERGRRQDPGGSGPCRQPRRLEWPLARLRDGVGGGVSAGAGAPSGVGATAPGSATCAAAPPDPTRRAAPASTRPGTTRATSRNAKLLRMETIGRPSDADQERGQPCRCSIDHRSPEAFSMPLRRW